MDYEEFYENESESEIMPIKEANLKISISHSEYNPILQRHYYAFFK